MSLCIVVMVLRTGPVMMSWWQQVGLTVYRGSSASLNYMSFYISSLMTVITHCVAMLSCFLASYLLLMHHSFLLSILYTQGTGPRC